MYRGQGGKWECVIEREKKDKYWRLEKLAGQTGFIL